MKYYYFTLECIYKQKQEDITKEIWLLMMSTIPSTMDHLGVMTNNSRMLVDLHGCLLTVLGDNVFTLLNVGCVNNSLAHWTRDLLGLVLWDFVALSVNMFLALGWMRAIAVSFMTSISLVVSISSMMSNNL